MITTLNYEKVPANFMHCLNNECRLADSCLRFQVACHLPAVPRVIHVLNPVHARSVDKCTNYRSDTPQKNGYGWTHMFDKLTYEKAVAIKGALLYHYGKSEFYRLKRKEKSFTLDEQMYVKSVFLRYGVEEDPVYDEYRYEYAW